MGESTLLDLLARAAALEQADASLEAPSGLRFVDRAERERFHTWGSLRTAALRVAGSLRRLGVERGERVALVYPTGIDFFHAFFGVLAAGAVPVPLYPPVRFGRLDEYHLRTASMLRAASARLVLADGRIRSLLGETIAAARPRLGCRTLSALPSVPPTDDDPDSGEPIRADDLALVQFSSGTTVDPKPVALSHRAVLAQVRALNGFWPDDSPVRHSGVSWLPLYHDMGLIGCVFPALEIPTVLTLLGPEVFVTRPALWLRAIARHRATVSVAPNFAYGLCVDRIRDDELDGVDLSCWRVALNGAEPVSPRVLRAFQERFAAWSLRPEALTPVYGLSEATLAVTFSDLETPFRTTRFDRDLLAQGRARVAGDGVELVSVGRPLPDTELEIRDDALHPLPESRIGRLWVRGPSLMEGYLDRADATARALVDGWLDTGDRGFLSGGELFLTGRAKDIVILRGRNYLPADIEHALDGVDGVRTGCVVAVSHLPEGGRNEELLLFVETRHDLDDATRSSLPRRCADAVLGSVGLEPDRVVPLAPGTLPRTSSGKLRRSEALRRWLEGRLEPPRRVTPWFLAGAWLRSFGGFLRARLGLRSAA
ncbi:MAG: fatty acyl-AMP ligase [Acidobacteriota bacterium]